jgi:hypothetical protein
MYGFFLVTAACVTGAVDPPGGCGCANPAGAQSGVVYYNAAPQGGVRQFVRGFLGLRPQPSPYPVVASTPQPMTAAAPVYQTEPPPVAGTQLAQAPEEQETAPPEPKLQIAEKNEDKVGHEDDYGWITGQLFFVRADGGRWVLRYGRLDETDRYGGSVVLAPTVEMRNFREGDVVCVHGQVVEEGRASRSLGGPLYRVSSITMVERADR